MSNMHRNFSLSFTIQCIHNAHWKYKYTHYLNTGCELHSKMHHHLDFLLWQTSSFSFFVNRSISPRSHKIRNPILSFEWENVYMIGRVRHQNQNSFDEFNKFSIIFDVAISVVAVGFTEAICVIKAINVVVDFVSHYLEMYPIQGAHCVHIENNTSHMHFHGKVVLCLYVWSFAIYIQQYFTIPISVYACVDFFHRLICYCCCCCTEWFSTSSILYVCFYSCIRLATIKYLRTVLHIYRLTLFHLVYSKFEFQINANFISSSTVVIIIYCYLHLVSLMKIFFQIDFHISYLFLIFIQMIGWAQKQMHVLWIHWCFVYRISSVVFVHVFFTSPN